MTTLTNDPIHIPFSSVAGAVRDRNHQVLQPVLTNLIALNLTMKQLHWNVVGPMFKPIHLQLDEITDYLNGAIDTVAERLAACGHSPTGTLRYVSAQADLDDPIVGFTRDEMVLLVSAQWTSEAVSLIRSRMEIIEHVDTVTADMLHQIVAKLEKFHWMLQAQRITRTLD